MNQSLVQFDAASEHEVASVSGTRGVLMLIALFYTAFVIYGSLVPLQYKPLSLEEAARQFKAIPFLQLGIESRADWVANLLLFTPLTFLWVGALAQRGRLACFSITLSVLIAAVALSFALEFTQLFFPQRTVSQNDIFAESIGALLGIVAWMLAGDRYTSWVGAAKLIHTRAALTDRIGWVYLLGLFVYNVLPLDLTISVVELFHKWQAGRIQLVPFASVSGRFSDVLYELSTDAIIWAVLAFLWGLSRTLSLLQIWLRCMVLAAILETLQLFVYSRVTDSTDLIMAGMGAALGCAATRRYKVDVTSSSSSLFFSKWVWLPTVLLICWMIILMWVFWFPFDFQRDATFIKARLGAMSGIPFHAYYYSSEFRAVTELLHKALFALPLGGLAAWLVSLQKWRWRVLVFAIAMVVLAGFPAVLELGQLMLPNKTIDITDVLIMWTGSLTGYSLARRLLRLPANAVPRARVATQTNPAAGTSSNGYRYFSIEHALMLIILTLLFFYSAQASFLPYNVREIMGPFPSWTSAVLLAFLCSWLINWPIFLAGWSASHFSWLALWLAGMLLYGGVSFLILYASVSMESLHDLLGSPVMRWRGQWEMALRWYALVLVPGTLLYLAAQTLRRLKGHWVPAQHFLIALPVLLLSYWGIVIKAATDNLIELLAEPHLLAFVALCAWVYTLFITALWLKSMSSIKMKFFLSLASLAFAYVTLNLGLSDSIAKYGQQFSALQFLLSVDRQHYAPEWMVWLRYSVLHLFAIWMFMLMQYPRLGLCKPMHSVDRATR